MGVKRCHARGFKYREGPDGSVPHFPSKGPLFIHMGTARLALRYCAAGSGGSVRTLYPSGTVASSVYF
eukprot:g24135.t1